MTLPRDCLPRKARRATTVATVQSESIQSLSPSFNLGHRFSRTPLLQCQLPVFDRTQRHLTWPRAGQGELSGKAGVALALPEED